VPRCDSGASAGTGCYPLAVAKVVLPKVCNQLQHVAAVSSSRPDKQILTDVDPCHCCPAEILQGARSIWGSFCLRAFVKQLSLAEVAPLPADVHVHFALRSCIVLPVLCYCSVTSCQNLTSSHLTLSTPGQWVMRAVTRSQRTAALPLTVYGVHPLLWGVGATPLTRPSSCPQPSSSARLRHQWWLPRASTQSFTMSGCVD
jgi:hypothetical protein